MALQKDCVFRGINVVNAYTRIHNLIIDQDSKVVKIGVYTYASQSARNDGAEPLYDFVITLDYSGFIENCNSNEPIAVAYNMIKELPDWVDSTSI